MWAYFAAKVASALALAVLIYALVWALAMAGARVPFDAARAARTLAALLLGVIAFAPMGFALAFWARPRAAAAIGNLLFLPLSFVSGFFTPLNGLPQILRDAAPWLPTYHFGLLVWGGVAPAEDVRHFTGVDPGPAPVSYTHLDVYKRQLLHRLGQLNEAVIEMTHLELAVIVGVERVAVLWGAAHLAPPTQDRADGNIRRLFVPEPDPIA